MVTEDEVDEITTENNDDLDSKTETCTQTTLETETRGTQVAYQSRNQGKLTF